MSEVTDFILARIAEDEAVAREVVEESFNGDGPISTGDDPWPSEAAFAGRHTPARVLRQCEAYRRIVRWAQQWPLRRPGAGDGIEAEDTLMRHLAAIWADHPEYQREWAA